MSDKVEAGLAAMLVAAPVPVGAYAGQLHLRARAEAEGEGSAVEAVVLVVMVVAIAVTIAAETWSEGCVGFLDADTSCCGCTVCRSGSCGWASGHGDCAEDGAEQSAGRRGYGWGYGVVCGRDEELHIHPRRAVFIRRADGSYLAER